MVKECLKKCSNCGINGHNARSCISLNQNNHKEKSFKLFGFKIQVPVEDESALLSDMRKCKSTPNLTACGPDHANVGAGYMSDGPQPKKRGVPWSEQEHKLFLTGLEKIGKGNWKGISKKYVVSRTPTQVASHAQKYFNRVNLPDKKNRRSSLFDMSLNEPEIKNSLPIEPPQNTTRQVETLPLLNANKNDAEAQAKDGAKGASTPLTPPPVLPYTPCYGMPGFSEIPYMPMVGMNANGQMMYLPPNPAYCYYTKNPGSNPLSIPVFPQVPYKV